MRILLPMSDVNDGMVVGIALGVCSDGIPRSRSFFC